MAVDVCNVLMHKKAFMALYFLLLKKDPKDVLVRLSLCM
jgi:hypothetical protein